MQPLSNTRIKKNGVGPQLIKKGRLSLVGRVAVTGFSCIAVRSVYAESVNFDGSRDVKDISRHKPR